MRWRVKPALIPSLSLPRIARPLLLIMTALLLFDAPIQAQSVSNLQKQLQRAIKNEDYDVVDNVLMRLGNSDDPKAAKVIVAALGILPLGEGLEAAIDALAALGSENVSDTFEKLLKKRRLDDTVGAVIVNVASKFDDEQSEEWLLDCLNRGSDFVVRNTIPAVVERKSKNAIPVLIDRLDKVGFAPSTESYQTRDALVALTGRDFDNTEDWRKWWSANQDSIDPKNLDKAEGMTGVERKLPGGYRPPQFFGVEILSNHVVFVVDTSGSMELWDKDESGGDEGNWRARRRIARVKKQLQETIEKLPESAHFNIIAFSDSVKRFQKKTVPASRKWKKKGLDFVTGMQANGATFTDDAMKAAFEEHDVDTIVLLSDGAPTRMGKKSRILMRQILEQVHKANILAKATLHVFGFTGEGEMPPGRQRPPPAPDDEDIEPEEFEEFLQKLATENGGKFTKIA